MAAVVAAGQALLEGIGIVTSTLLTLAVLPVLYAVVTPENRAAR